MTASPEMKPVRILLVDDDRLIRSLGRELLENLGYAVETAENGEEVLEQCGQGPPPELVILDFNLPGGISGLALLQRLREIHPAGRVLLASGFFSKQEMAELQEAGAAGFLFKPFRVAELKSRIEEVLGGLSGS